MERCQYKIGDTIKFLNHVGEIIRIDKSTVIDDIIIVRTNENEELAIFTWMIDCVITKEA